ncbi:MAG TPA: hypothetical protein VN612_03555 [Acidobacteriaceae bacterium]|nr:hypothetical protein [Acidobacteriaceae bacterium]
MRAVVDCGLKEAPDGGSFFDCRRLDEGEQIGDRGFEVQGARCERVGEVRNAYGFVILAMVKAIEIEYRKMDAAEIAGGSVDRQCSSSERLQNTVHGIQNGATGMERPDADGTAASEGAGAATVKGGLAAMPIGRAASGWRRRHGMECRPAWCRCNGWFSALDTPPPNTYVPWIEKFAAI